MDRNEVILAVFPFENLSTAKEFDIFCRSFNLDVVTELSRFRQFHIISLDSLLYTTHQSDNQLLEKIHPDYLIKGSFRAERDSVRLNVQLIHCPSHRIVWADRISGKIPDILEMQEEVLKKLTASLQAQLNYNLLSLIRKKPKTSLKAYENWLYGYYELKKGTPASDLKAREYFQNAIKQDPEYSLAYSGMSLSYFNEWSCQLWDRWELSQNGAFRWAEKAIELDEQNYVANYVLGRLLVYNHAFETAEQLLRKSIFLNANDLDSLVNIAVCFLYLGYPKEAASLYERALRLNPSGTTAYAAPGALILIENARYEEAIRVAETIEKPPYLDFHAHVAAAWHHLGNEQKMWECWKKFLSSFSEGIKGGAKSDTAEAIQWLYNVNPFKSSSKTERFWNHLSDGKFQIPAIASRRQGENEKYTLRKQQDYWELEFGNKKCLLPEVKGFYDLTKLLAVPGSPFHSVELMGITLDHGGEKVFDEKAKKAYQNRILELQQEIGEADANNDFSGLYSLQEEYERLIDHLSKSLNIRGQIREKGNPAEKARAAVTWRIRHAIAKIEEVHPAMGRHLANSVKTGTFCVYEPEKEMNWAL